MQLISQPKPLGKGYFFGGTSGQQWVWVTGSSNSMEMIMKLLICLFGTIWRETLFQRFLGFEFVCFRKTIGVLLIWHHNSTRVVGIDSQAFLTEFINDQAFPNPKPPTLKTIKKKQNLIKSDQIWSNLIKCMVLIRFDQILFFF